MNSCWPLSSVTGLCGIYESADPAGIQVVLEITVRLVTDSPNRSLCSSRHLQMFLAVCFTWQSKMNVLEPTHRWKESVIADSP